MGSPRFVKVDSAFLAAISSGCDRIPTAYYEGSVLINIQFWARLRTIFRHILRSGAARRRSLDFGGGGGVFLPTLSGLFEQVTLIDLVTNEARAVVDKYALKNVTLVEENVLQAELHGFDVVIAADVLEHFQDLRPAIDVLRTAVTSEGVLITSLPTENFLYRALRAVFGIEKPADHYHTATEVERSLAEGGFRRVRTTRLPTVLAPLFVITTWRGAPLGHGKTSQPRGTIR